MLSICGFGYLLVLLSSIILEHFKFAQKESCSKKQNLFFFHKIYRHINVPSLISGTAGFMLFDKLKIQCLWQDHSHLSEDMMNHIEFFRIFIWMISFASRTLLDHMEVPLITSPSCSMAISMDKLYFWILIEHTSYVYTKII